MKLDRSLIILYMNFELYFNAKNKYIFFNVNANNKNIKEK